LLDNFQYGGSAFVRGGLDILKIDKNSTDLVFHVSIWGLGTLFLQLSPPNTRCDGTEQAVDKS